MGDAKTIINLIGDIYMLNNPNFFYNEVVYFPIEQKPRGASPFLTLSDIFIDQIDVKLVEEQSADSSTDFTANFFFKS